MGLPRLIRTARRGAWRLLPLALGLALGASAGVAKAGSSLSYAFSSYSIEAGLPNNVVPEGRLIKPATATSGLARRAAEVARFDGVRFTTPFRGGATPPAPRRQPDPLPLRGSRRHALDRDPGRPLRYRDGKFEQLPGIGKAVSAIAAEANGRVWVSPPGARASGNTGRAASRPTRATRWSPPTNG